MSGTSGSGPALDVEVRDVRLRYQDAPEEALRGLSFRIEAGTICGLLGRNGSGKTSVLSLLASMRRPDAGEVRIGGVEPFEDAAVMSQVALMGQSDRAGTVHSINDALRMAGLLRPSWDEEYADKLLDQFGIPRRRGQKVASLSRGQRAAFGVVCALAARAPVTLLDESHLGMDAPSRYAFYDELLRDCMERPRTVILSTHHIDEVASLFGEVIIIDAGQLVLQADTDTLRGRGTELIGPAERVERLVEGMTVLDRRRLGGTEAVVAYGTLGDDRRRQAEADGVAVGPIPLQDLFVHLTAPAPAADVSDVSDEPEEHAP